MISINEYVWKEYGLVRIRAMNDKLFICAVLSGNTTLSNHYSELYSIYLEIHLFLRFDTYLMAKYTICDVSTAQASDSRKSQDRS